MEEPTIHEFDFDLINEYFTELERLGPGSPAETVRALGLMCKVSINNIKDISGST